MMSQTAEYALLAVVAIAQHHPHLQSVGRIAEMTGVPEGYLSKVLQRLARAQLVQARRGTLGGFVLAREPQEISALDVINAISPLQAHGDFPVRGGRPDFKPLLELMESTHAFIEQRMRESTIASLAPSGSH